MVTEALLLAMRVLLAGAVLLAASGAVGAADGVLPALAQARELFAQQRYREAADTLEALPADTAPDARVHLLLGEAYGRMAERAPWYRALRYARRCGVELERAVTLDPRNRDALAALARFYEEAPALVGGGADKAQLLRRRLEALERAGGVQEPR